MKHSVFATNMKIWDLADGCLLLLQEDPVYGRRPLSSTKCQAWVIDKIVYFLFGRIAKVFSFILSIIKVSGKICLLDKLMAEICIPEGYMENRKK